MNVESITLAVDYVQRLGPYEDIGLEPAEIVKRLKDAEKAAEGRNA